MSPARLFQGCRNHKTPNDVSSRTRTVRDLLLLLSWDLKAAEQIPLPLSGIGMTRSEKRLA